MFDISQIIALVVIIVAIYFIVKFILSPALKLIVGIFLFFLILALVQYFLHINVQQLFGPYGKYFDVSVWTTGFTWLADLVIQYANQTFTFIQHAASTPPK